MPIYTRKKQYEVPPAGIPHQAVCVDVVDLGVIETGFGPQEKVKIVWQLALENKKGNRFLVSQRFTPSLHPKSKLRPILESWRGKPFTPAELKRFDIESLVGVNANLILVHNMSDDSIWANVSTVIPPTKGADKLYPMDYTREVEREGYVAPQQPAEEPEYEEPMDDANDVPF